MSAGDLQYIAETRIMEKVIRLRAPLERQAGVLDLIGSSLGSVAQQIQQHVLSDIDTSSTGSLVISVLKLLEPALLFRRYWLLGLLDGVAQAMGFSLTDIVVKMVSFIKNMLMGGQPVSVSDIHRIGSSMIAAESGSAADDIYRDAFDVLQDLDNKGQLFKFAAGPLSVFRSLGRFRTYSLLVRIVGWFLKTILLSAGLLVGGGIVAKTLGLSKQKPTEEKKEPLAFEQEAPTPGAGMVRQPSVVLPISVMPSVSGLHPSGRGEEYHPNDDHTAWIVPVYGSVKDTLLGWTVEIYPELRGRENIIMSTPSFNRMANVLSGQLDYRTPNYLMMPRGVNKRIDIVNTFINDIAKQLPQKG